MKALKQVLSRLSFAQQSIAVMGLMSVSSQAMATGASPVQVFEQFVGNRTLDCVVQVSAKARVPVSFRIGDIGGGRTGIVMHETDERGARSTVDGAAIRGSNLLIHSSNDVDGPLASETFLLPLSGLSQLARREVQYFYGIDSYSEGYDGTRQQWRVACRML